MFYTLKPLQLLVLPTAFVVDAIGAWGTILTSCVWAELKHVAEMTKGTYWNAGMRHYSCLLNFVGHSLSSTSIWKNR